MTHFMLGHMHINSDILKDPKYQYLFSVEQVNEEVLKGVPFRDAYKKVGLTIENGEFSHSGVLKHTHEGSIGNLCTAEITANFEQVYKQFGFAKVNQALENLAGK